MHFSVQVHICMLHRSSIGFRKSKLHDCIFVTDEPCIEPAAFLSPLGLPPMFVGVQQAAALLSLPRLAYPQMVMLTRGRNTLNISAPMLSDAGTKPTTCQLCVKNGTVEAALFSPPRVPPLFVVLLWTVKRILGQNSLNSTVAMPSKLSALEPAGPVKRRRIPKIEIQRERRAISKPVHGLKYSDHQETQGHFLQVKADTEIDNVDSLWTTDWLATLERDNVWQDIVQRERRWKRHVLKDVSQRVRERRQ